MFLTFPLSVVDISLLLFFFNQDSQEMKSDSLKIPFLLLPIVPFSNLE